MSSFCDRVWRGCPGAPRQKRREDEPLRPIAFLDRDGVVNADKGYVHTIDEFEWMPGAIEAVKFLNSRGYIVAIVTNQSGIGRGYYGEEEFMALTEWMLKEVDRLGANIDVVYYCPHHPESTDPKYSGACPARKPGSAMLERAAEEYKMDKARSFLVGNRDSDLGAAESFGVRGYDYQDGDLAAFIREIVEG